MKDLFTLYQAVTDANVPVHVARNVHLNDMILHFLLDHPGFPTPASAVAHYFDDGAKSGRILAGLLDELQVGRNGSPSLLEFASGYGRVTRHLKDALPSASVTSCDIHPDAVQFIKEVLETTAVVSHRVPEQLALPQRYDVVFALSFYSHMPRETWGRWIRAHLSALTDTGILIFTTHGLLSAPLFGGPHIPADGFWFRADSEQKDLPVADYGSTLVTREYVERELQNVAGASVEQFRQGFWWTHQDLYVVRRAACRAMLA
jgi:SAM-dependent methyltransferase